MRVFVGFAALFALFFSPVLLEGRVLAHFDALFQTVPPYHAPPALWNPLIFCGFPSAADPQTMTLYPLARIGLPWNAFAVAAYALAATFAYAYVRGLTGSRAGALVAGIGYGMGGFLVARVHQIHIVHAAAWIPLALLFIDRLRARASARDVAGLAVAIACLALAGHPQTLAYGAALIGAYALLARSAAGAGGAALGAGLAAILLVPAAELAAESVRARIDFAEFVSFALRPAELPVLALPLRLGARAPGAEGGFAEIAAYPGLLAIALAGIAVARRGRAGAPSPWFWAAVAAASVLLALGDATPLARLAYELPVLRLFRVPARHLVEWSLAVPVLAGIGVAALERADAPARARAGAIGAALVAAAIPLATPRGNALPAIAFGAGAAALLLWARRPGGWRTALLAGALAADLACFGYLRCEWRAAAPARDVLRAPAGLAALEGRIFPALGIASPASAGHPNLTSLWGIPSASGYSPLALRRYAALLDMDVNGFHAGGLPAARLAEEDRALDLLAVRHVTIPATVIEGSPSARWRPVAIFEPRAERPVAVLENRRALPRARLVAEARALAPDDALRTIRTSRFPDGSPYDPTATALVEDSPFRGAPGGAVLEVRDVSATEVCVRVRAPMDGGAFLVLADAFYPGWEAHVNGAPAPIRRADFALRGVAVPAGEHEVRFRYRPASFRRGAAISGASAAVLVALLAAGALRRRGRAG